jgi:glycosyltransferase involved in cell wall biosynthesis
MTLELATPNPKVSVIVPVYNALPFLTRCLDDISTQTLQDIEIICVDDGSTDGSRSVLDNYAQKDTRFKILTQNHQFAGTARNRGIDESCGDYLMFLDADDLFEPQLIRRLYTACEADDSQMAVCRSDIFDTTSGKFYRNNAISRALYPKHNSFIPPEYADLLFQFVTPTPWAKLFRRDLIMDSGLRFEARRKVNDLYFVFCTAAIARSISFVDDVLVHLRRGHAGNLQSQHERDPFDFAGALLSVRQELIKRRVFHTFERSYVNSAVLESSYVMQALRNRSAYDIVISRLQGELLEAFGVLDREPQYFHSFMEYGALQWLLSPQARSSHHSTAQMTLFMIRSGLRQFGIFETIRTICLYILKKSVQK